MKGTRVGILGIAYKANVDDTRESPAIKIIEFVKKHKSKVFTFDPHVLSVSTEKSLGKILRKAEVLIITVNHDEFKNIDPEVFKKNNIRIIIDGKNCLDKKAIEKVGIIYCGIGR